MRRLAFKVLLKIVGIVPLNFVQLREGNPDSQFPRQFTAFIQGHPCVIFPGIIPLIAHLTFQAGILCSSFPEELKCSSAPSLRSRYLQIFRLTNVQSRRNPSCYKEEYQNKIKTTVKLGYPKKKSQKRKKKSKVNYVHSSKSWKLSNILN